MRHARARLEIVVVSREAALRLLPVRLEIGVVSRVEVVEVVAVPASFERFEKGLLKQMSSGSFVASFWFAR